MCLWFDCLLELDYVLVDLLYGFCNDFWNDGLIQATLVLFASVLCSWFSLYGSCLCRRALPAACLVFAISFGVEHRDACCVVLWGAV